MTDDWHYSWFEAEIEDGKDNIVEKEYMKELLCFLSSIDEKLSRLLERLGERDMWK